MLLKLIAILVVTLLAWGCGGKSKEELYVQGTEMMKAKNASAAVVLFKNALEKDQNFFDARFELAKAFAMQGKFEQAEKELLKAIAQNPNSDKTSLELARIYNQTKRPDQGFKLAGTYLEKHPGNAEAYEVMGLSCAVREMYRDAEQYFQKAIQADPSNHTFILELASTYVAEKELVKAREALSKALAADAKNLRAWYMLASLNQLEGQSQAALDVYAKIRAINPAETQAAFRAGLIRIRQNQLDKADALADSLIQEFPGRSEGYRLKGLVQYQHKQYAEASTSLQTSVKILPTLDAYYYLGMCSYNRGELEGALSHFRKILDRSPDARQARVMTAMVLLAQKRTDDAIAELNKVIKQHENDAQAYTLLGSAYMAKGMFEEGMKALNAALRINPKSAEAHLKKGSYFFNIGKVNEGETELLAAVQVAPDQLANRLLLASTYLRSNKPQKALELLKAGLTKSRSDAPLYSSMATIMFMQKKRDAGVAYLQKAKEFDPTFAPPYQSLATIYAVAGKYDQAIKEFQALLSKSPDNLSAMLQLAALYDVAGKDDEALAQLARAKATKKTAAFVAEAQYFIKKKQISKSLTTLDDALKLEPRDPQLLDMKGKLLSQQNEFKDALKVADELEVVHPDAGIALKIQVYMRKKDTKQALEQARRVIEKYPRSAQGYLLLASIYEFGKQYPEAITEVKKGVQVNPKDLQAKLYLGNLQVAHKEYAAAATTYADILKVQQYAPALFAQGALLQQTGKMSEAVTKYRAAISVSERYVPALNNLAYLCAEGFCDKGEALSLSMKAYRLEPANIGVMDTLGYALLVNGRYDDARKVLEKTASLLPAVPTIQYHLGLLYKATGDLPKARQALKKALAAGAFPEDGKARELLSSLANR